jgi:hypothetical protein
LRAEGFSCSLDFSYGGLGISKLQFLIKKISNIFSAVNFFLIFGHKAWILIGFQPKNAKSGSGINES